MHLPDHITQMHVASSVCRSLLFHVVQHWVNVYNCVYTQCHIALSVASYPGCSLKEGGNATDVTTDVEEEGSICDDERFGLAARKHVRTC